MVYRSKSKILQNCIDRHLNKRGKTAIVFEPNDPTEKALHITYNELHQRVCKWQCLREQGIEKGDRVCIYLPMIPELAVSMLACARIGAIHSVFCWIFCPVATRIIDSDCRMVITSDGGYRGNKTIELKAH
jgi:acetyl-CoA synthetase